MTRNKKKEKFPGLPSNWSKPYFKYPRMLEGYWYMLNGSEQKVLTFILHQTIGFHKDSDITTLEQFQNGIGKNNKGTGLSKGSVISGINGLVDKGFIWKKKISYRKVEYGLMVQKYTKDGPNLEKDGSSLEQMVSPKNETPIEDSNRDSTIEKEIEKIFSLYKEKICPDSRLTRKGTKLITERLKEYPPRDLEKAIINFSMHKWWMDNHSGNGIEWFFNSEGQIDKFMNLPPSPENKEEKLRLPKFQL